MYISQQLLPSHISTDLQGRTVDEILFELASLATQDSKNLDPEKISYELVKREELLSTAMGFGLALPHCTSKKIKEPLFALGISRHGIEVDAPDGQPVSLFFIVISPEKDPNVHLSALSAAARVFINAQLREAILAAHSAEEILSAIHSVEYGNEA